MAEAMTNRILRLLAAAALSLSFAAAQAQSLQDPTRPPATPATGDKGAPAYAGPQLQSILIGREQGGRRVAVIDGETVRLGETWNGARVARITPHQVELVRGKERQVLKLASESVSEGDASWSVKPVARR
jgi:MSHA biogenesis protein MshK